MYNRKSIMSKTVFKKLKQFFVANLLRCNTYDLLTGISILSYGIIFSYFTVLKHYNFASYAADLGVFDQAFYTTLFHRKLFYYTPELWLNPSGCFFAVHFSPILFLLLPVYAIYPSPESLLIAQSFLLAIAAVPLYLLSTTLLRSKSAGFALVIAYLLFTPLHGANWFDFHPQAFIPILIFSVYYFAIKKSWKLYLVSVALALMIQEHLVYIIFVLAIYNLFVGRLKSIISSIKNLNRGNVLPSEGLKLRIIGLIKHLSRINRTSASISTIIICAGWYLITKQVKSFYPITPEFLDIYRAIGAFEVLGFKDDILLLPIYVILNPQNAFKALTFDFHIKFLYIMLLFGPLLFLSFRSRLSLIIFAILIPILLTNYTAYYTLGAQYPLYLTPFIFIAAIDSLSTIQAHQLNRLKSNPVAIKSDSLEPLLKHIIVVSMIFTISASPLTPFAYTFADRGIFWYPSSPPLDAKNFVESLHAMITLIPPNASILTQNCIFPHVSSRIDTYLIPFDLPSFREYGKKEIIENYTRQMMNNSDYVLLNVNAQDYWSDFVLKEISNGQFGIYALTYSFVLFKRNHDEAPMFIPDINYEVFLVYRDHIIDSGEIVPDASSKSGYVAFSEKGVNNGSFIYGPYVCLPSGTFNVTFEIKVGEHNDGYIGTFDVTDDHGSPFVSRRYVYGFELQTNEWINLTLPFTSTKFRTALEFRAFSSGTADIYVDRVIVKRISSIAGADFGPKTFNSRDLLLVSGYTSEEGFLIHQHNVTSYAFWYGPYTTLPPGSYNVSFFLKIAPSLTGLDEKILTLDVTSDCGSDVLAEYDVYSSSFLTSDKISDWREFTLQFTAKDNLENVEFRGITPSPNYDIHLAFILVDRLS